MNKIIIFESQIDSLRTLANADIKVHIYGLQTKKPYSAMLNNRCNS